MAVLAGLIFEQMSTTYLVLVDGKTRVRIPRMIVLLKDCDAYKEWFESRFTPLSASTDRCPWTKPPKGNVGEFIINGEVFHIPRDYLIFDKNIPDGKTGGLLLMAVYPDMQPATWEKEEFDDRIKILIESSEGWENCEVQSYCDACKFKDHCSPSQYEYEHLSHMKDIKKEDLRTYFTKEEEIPRLDITRYALKNDPTRYYVRGNPLKPSYWLVCIGGCESHFDFNSKIRIEYTFNRKKHLQNHDDIRERVLEKLREWQQ